MADSRLEEQLEALENLPFDITRLLTEMRGIDARVDVLQKEITTMERAVLRAGKARSGNKWVLARSPFTRDCAPTDPPPRARLLSS